MKRNRFPTQALFSTVQKMQSNHTKVNSWSWFSLDISGLNSVKFKSHAGPSPPHRVDTMVLRHWWREVGGPTHSWSVSLLWWSHLICIASYLVLRQNPFCVPLNWVITGAIPIPRSLSCNIFQCCIFCKDKTPACPLTSFLTNFPSLGKSKKTKYKSFWIFSHLALWLQETWQFLGLFTSTKTTLFTAIFTLKHLVHGGSGAFSDLGASPNREIECPLTSDPQI